MSYSFYTNSTKIHCSKCDKESKVEWLSFFDKIIGKMPSYCPWCGYKMTDGE